jgi:tRNA-splicing ligase RtcB (3'-phosphate/5'-hydroxy nucleic acid ligase)
VSAWCQVEIYAESRYRFVIPRQGRMRVPRVVFATRALIPDPAADHALGLCRKVARLVPLGVIKG